MKKPKLIDKWFSLLPADLREMVEAVLHAARNARLNTYLVGGPVRDLLLGRVSLDVDICVEGDAMALAYRAAADLGARAITHRTFLTATLRRHPYHLDLATARSETYRRPGALPTVAHAAIGVDLRRRDFTINAIALALTGDRRGSLLDPCGGRRDLSTGVIRILHDGSFRDDATRILRAVRYAVRFRFQIEQRTLEALKRDVRYLDTISGARLRRELARTLGEEEPERTLERLQELGALARVHPGLAFDRRKARALVALRRLGAPLPLSYWPVLAWKAGERVTARLALPRAEAEATAATPRAEEAAAPFARPDIRPSEATALLDQLPPATVWALAALSDDPIRERCLTYLRRWRTLRPSLRGHDLVALGVPPGPAVGDALRRLKAAKLDGEAPTRADEERLALQLVGLYADR